MGCVPVRVKLAVFQRVEPQWPLPRTTSGFNPQPGNRDLRPDNRRAQSGNRQLLRRNRLRHSSNRHFHPCNRRRQPGNWRQRVRNRPTRSGNRRRRSSNARKHPGNRHPQLPQSSPQLQTRCNHLVYKRFRHIRPKRHSNSERPTVLLAKGAADKPPTESRWERRETRSIAAMHPTVVSGKAGTVWCAASRRGKRRGNEHIQGSSPSPAHRGGRTRSDSGNV